MSSSERIPNREEKSEMKRKRREEREWVSPIQSEIHTKGEVCSTRTWRRLLWPEYFIVRGEVCIDGFHDGS